MESYVPKYLLWTVPHSGTRFTWTAFERAGLRCVHGYRQHMLDKQRPDFIWCHIDTHKILGECAALALKVPKEFLVVRDPIMTWASWMYEPLRHTDNPDFYVGAAMFTLEDHWRAQNMLVKSRDDLYIHRIEHDSLEDLGQWAGLELTGHNRRFASGKHPLKQAILNKDEEAIEEALDGTGAWKRFKRDAELYGDFYSSLGYNLWWT